MESNPEEVTPEVLLSTKSTGKEETLNIHHTLSSIPPTLPNDDECLHSDDESSKKELFLE